MYELYFGDETTMPCTYSHRFKNFKKNLQLAQTQQQRTSVPRPPQPEPIGEIKVPEDIEEILIEHDVTETPFIFMRSNLSSKTTKGDAYAIGYDEFLVIMWRKDDDPFKLVKLEHYDVVDVSGGVEDDDDSIIVLMISTEERTYSLWFSASQSEELVTFINSWKYHQVHRIGGKTEYSFDDEAEEEELVENEPDVSGVPIAELPRTVLFGTLLIDQVADGHNITELDLEFLNMTITNPDLLAMCIQTFKRDSAGEIKEIVKNDFTDKQKLMLMSNMADLAYRNGDAHEEELDQIKKLGEFISFDTPTLLDLIEIFKVKNDPETLESY